MIYFILVEVNSEVSSEVEELGERSLDDLKEEKKAKSDKKMAASCKDNLQMPEVKSKRESSVCSLL